MDKKGISKEDLVEFQMLGQQINELNEYIKSIDAKILEVTINVESLKEFKKVKENENLLVPVVPGIFVNGKIKESNKVMISVGRNIIIESNIDHAINILEQQLKELQDHRKDVEKELSNLLMKAQILQNKLKE